MKLNLPCIFATQSNYDMKMLRKAINRVISANVKFKMLPVALVEVGKHTGYFRAVFYVGVQPKTEKLREILTQKGVTMV